MKGVFNTSKIFSDLKKRKNYDSREIFFTINNIYTQTQFSNFLSYFIFKSRSNLVFFTKLRNRCILSANSRGVISKYKISRHAFSFKAAQANLTGFYASV
jgi:ribosomal protein S14